MGSHVRGKARPTLVGPCTAPWTPWALGKQLLLLRRRPFLSGKQYPGHSTRISNTGSPHGERNAPEEALASEPTPKSNVSRLGESDLPLGGASPPSALRVEISPHDDGGCPFRCALPESRLKQCSTRSGGRATARLHSRPPTAGAPLSMRGAVPPLLSIKATSHMANKNQGGRV